MIEHSQPLDELGQIQQWFEEGLETIVLASVVQTWGSAPRPVGSFLAVKPNGSFAGSVSGGCIEGAVISAALDLFQGGEPQTLKFLVSTEQAWSVGLSCGGTIEVHLRRIAPSPVWSRLCELRQHHQAVAWVFELDSDRDCLVTSDGPGFGELGLDAEALRLVHAALACDQANLLEGSSNLFVRPCNPPLRLVAVGGVHIAQYLIPMAEMSGFRCVLVDPRKSFACEDRFPRCQVLNLWPQEALEGLVPDSGTAIVTLTHDPKIDDPALSAALRSPAFYVGALGSKASHAKRLARLGGEFSTEQLARIHGPVGLDLGSKAPAHIATAILAQIIAQRFKPSRL